MLGFLFLFIFSLSKKIREASGKCPQEMSFYTRLCQLCVLIDCSPVWQGWVKEGCICRFHPELHISSCNRNSVDTSPSIITKSSMKNQTKINKSQQMTDLSYFIGQRPGPLQRLLMFQWISTRTFLMYMLLTYFTNSYKPTHLDILECVCPDQFTLGLLNPKKIHSLYSTFCEYEQGSQGIEG